MRTLCFASNLTSAEWAAWVQAIGSVLAILGAAGIALWQSRAQHKNALALHAAEQRYLRTELTLTLSVLATNCLKAVTFLSSQLKDRDAVHDAAEGRFHLDLGELARIDNSLASISLHGLPSVLVNPTMILSATVRQFREKVELAIHVHRRMDAQAFDDFFRTVAEIQQSLKRTCDEIAAEVARERHE